MTRLEPITLDIQVDTSRLQASTRALRKTSWQLGRQRRTLRWRRLDDGTVEVQQRIAPWALPTFLPATVRRAVQAAADAERDAMRAGLVRETQTSRHPEG